MFFLVLTSCLSRFLAKSELHDLNSVSFCKDKFCFSQGVSNLFAIIKQRIDLLEIVLHEFCVELRQIRTRI